LTPAPSGVSDDLSREDRRPVSLVVSMLSVALIARNTHFRYG
jgi:hypothetical protein